MARFPKVLPTFNVMLDKQTDFDLRLETAIQI